jgi:hypothetical protein
MLYHRVLENEKKPFNSHYALEDEPLTYLGCDFRFINKTKNALMNHQGIFNIINKQ